MKTSQVIIGLAASIGVLLIGWYLYMQQTPSYERTFKRGLKVGSSQSGKAGVKRVEAAKKPATKGPPAPAGAGTEVIPAKTPPAAAPAEGSAAPGTAEPAKAAPAQAAPAQAAPAEAPKAAPAESAKPATGK